MEEIHSGAFAQNGEQPLQAGFLLRVGAGRTFREPRVTGEFLQFLGYEVRRQDEIRHSRQDRVLRHAGKTRRLVLSEGDSARAFDRLQAQCSIRCRPGKDDADRAALPVLSQRAQEIIDGQVVGAVLGARSQMQHAIGYPHLDVRRDHVDVVCFHWGAVLSLFHQHGGLAREDLDQGTLVIRVKVLNHNIGQPRGWVQVLKKAG